MVLYIMKNMCMKPKDTSKFEVEILGEYFCLEVLK